MRALRERKNAAQEFLRNVSSHHGGLRKIPLVARQIPHVIGTTGEGTRQQRSHARAVHVRAVVRTMLLCWCKGGLVMFKRILVPMDFSAPSDAALEQARSVATRFGASLHLLHVADDPYRVLY